MKKPNEMDYPSWMLLNHLKFDPLHARPNAVQHTDGSLNSQKQRQHMIKISLLADCPESVPTLVRWFRTQWPDYFAGRTEADIAQDFFLEANRNGIPVRLVAFADGELAGTITLRDRAMNALPEYHPGLGGLFVIEQHRGQGIGSELVRAGMHVAREQGYQRIYATTVAARGILERLGWKPIQRVSDGDEKLMIYSCDL